MLSDLGYKAGQAPLPQCPLLPLPSPSFLPSYPTPCLQHLSRAHW